MANPLSGTFDAGQRVLLERIAGGAPLSALLEDIVHLIERQAEGTICSILLLSNDGTRVVHGAAPSLPREFVAHLDGSLIGPTAGSCGTAAYRRERVIVDDIATHPYWDGYRELALPYGLRACWSTPILAPNCSVLGTFAIYYREVRHPDAHEIAWVDAATHLAAIAILHDRSEQSLRRTVRDLGERVKELTLLHQTARLLHSDRPLDQALMSELATLMPPAWLYPDLCMARVAWGDLEAATPDWHVTPWMLSSAFEACGRQGVVEVAYREKPDEPNGPFLPEERQLLHSLADMLSAHIGRHLSKENEKLRALIYSSVADVIFYLIVEHDSQFRFVSVNPAFLSATGLREEQVVGKLVGEVIPEPSCSQAIAKYHTAIETGQPISWDEVTVYPAGIRYGEVTVAPVLDEQGRCTNLVGTVHDITLRKMAEEERRELELQLHQSQRMQSLGTLAGGIAHDFNNVLTAIGGNADLALLDLPVNHIAREHIAEIQRASRRASDLVRQILAFGRRQEPNRTVLDLRQTILEALKLLRATLPATVQIRTRLSPDTPTISADATQLHQVIMNLGTNAAHAIGSKNGIIDVASDRVILGSSPGREAPELPDGTYARISVTDNGSGMDEATLARAFEPFFTTKPQGTGTGLGLSVVHGIIKSHQGAVTVASRVGEGTLFNLYFPAVEAEPGETPQMEDATGHGERVMYVDDETALVHVATRILTRFGYDVTGYSDVTQALERFRSTPHDFDIVVTDVTMPKLSGVEFAREVLGIRPDIPILLLSGHVRPEDVAAARLLGVKDVVMKPAGSELARIIRRVISQGSRSPQ